MFLCLLLGELLKNPRARDELNETVSFFLCNRKAGMANSPIMCRTGALNHRRKTFTAAFKVELTNLRIISPQTVRK